MRPLDRFYTRVELGRVQIGDRFSLNSDLERFSPRDPSNHLDGLWQYLYPRGRRHGVPRFHAPCDRSPAPRRQRQRPQWPDGSTVAPPKPTVKDHALEGTASAIGWVEERTGLSPFLRGFLFRKV